MRKDLRKREVKVLDKAAPKAPLEEHYKPVVAD